MTCRKNVFYLPWIDGLRAIAALSVILHHGPTLRSVPAFKNYLGWFGVDLFLVLSAFLLSRLLQMEYAATRTVNVRNFFVRRVLRIWPLYLFIITFSLLYAWSTHTIEAREATGWYLAHITFTQNLAASVHSYSTLPFTAHLWTIALEEQAYVLMPIFIGAYLRDANAKWLAKALVAAVAMFVLIRLSVVVLGRQHPYVWVSPLRADTFLFGIFLGLCTSIGADKRRAPAIVLFSAAALVACLAIWMGAPGLSDMAEVIGYPLTGAACCLLIFAVDQSALATRVLGSKSMRHLGKISYGVYVFHILGLRLSEMLVEQVGVSAPYAQLVIAIVITLALAEISYHLLERPFLLLKERFTVVQNRPA